MNIERWSVWLANLDPVVGSEQGKTRPVLIISQTALNQILPVVNVLPITSRKPNRRIYPNEALIKAAEANLANDSIVLCFQILTLDEAKIKQTSWRFNKRQRKKQNHRSALLSVGNQF